MGLSQQAVILVVSAVDFQCWRNCEDQGENDAENQSFN